MQNEAGKDDHACDRSPRALRGPRGCEACQLQVMRTSRHESHRDLAEMRKEALEVIPGPKKRRAGIAPVQAIPTLPPIPHRSQGGHRAKRESPGRTRYERPRGGPSRRIDACDRCRRPQASRFQARGVWKSLPFSSHLNQRGVCAAGVEFVPRPAKVAERLQNYSVVPWGHGWGDQAGRMVSVSASQSMTLSWR